MNHLSLAQYSLHSMSHRQLRSWLTVLGIVIGIGAIVVLIALGQGIDQEIRGQLAVLGSKYIMVLPGQLSLSGGTDGGFGTPVLKGALYNRDVNALKRIPGIDAVTGMLSQQLAPIKYRDESVNLEVSAGDPEALNKYITTGYASGKAMKNGDTESVVIGYNVANTLFKRKIEFGQTINVLGRNFRVKGILNKVGAAGTDIDNGVYIDLQAMRQILGSAYDKNRVTVILIIIKDGVDIEKVSADVEKTLVNMHHVKSTDKDFTVMSALTIAQSVGQITAMLSLFLGGIAAISLLVGGIGIANAMFTSVLERTREIGVLKSIGASNETILEIFLIEAALIGALGGLIGIAFGSTLGLIASYFGVPIVITVELVAFALCFSIGVGVISGVFPARQAAALQPVEALRYE